MTKKQLSTLLPGFASSAYALDLAGQAVLEGKFVSVLLLESIWDIYLCNNRSQHDLLTERKMTNLLQRSTQFDSPFRRLDGEGYFQTKNTSFLNAWLLENAKVLGLRKKSQTTGNFLRRPLS